MTRLFLILDVCLVLGGALASAIFFAAGDYENACVIFVGIFATIGLLEGIERISRLIRGIKDASEPPSIKPEHQTQRLMDKYRWGSIDERNAAFWHMVADQRSAQLKHSLSQSQNLIDLNNQLMDTNDALIEALRGDEDTEIEVHALH